MNIAIGGITAVVTLMGVALGGWLSLHNQDRAWRRDHARQWRDIRLDTHKEFLSAYRQYLAFIIEPNAQILAIPHPKDASILMPIFDETGRPYRERFEAAIMAVRLVSEQRETVDAAKNLINRTRDIAAARATHSNQDLPPALFDELWRAHKRFLVTARHELGLSTLWQVGQQPSPGASS